MVFDIHWFCCYFSYECSNVFNDGTIFERKGNGMRMAAKPSETCVVFRFMTVRAFGFVNLQMIRKIVYCSVGYLPCEVVDMTHRYPFYPSPSISTYIFRLPFQFPLIPLLPIRFIFYKVSCADDVTWRVEGIWQIDTNVNFKFNAQSIACTLILFQFFFIAVDQQPYRKVTAPSKDSVL